MSFLRYFIYIVCGALASSVIGGVFACAVALVSPEFVRGLFSSEFAAVRSSPLRYAAAVGMIWGIFLGTAVMGFSLLLVTLTRIARLIKKKSDEQSLS